METLEELKAIRDKAKSGGYTLISLCGSNFYRLEGSDWIGFDADETEFIEYEMPATRSLSDINSIIELMEWQEAAFEAYPNIDIDIDNVKFSVYGV